MFACRLWILQEHTSKVFFISHAILVLRSTGIVPRALLVEALGSFRPQQRVEGLASRPLRGQISFRMCMHARARLGNMWKRNVQLRREVCLTCWSSCCFKFMACSRARAHHMRVVVCDISCILVILFQGQHVLQEDSLHLSLQLSHMVHAWYSPPRAIGLKRGRSSRTYV